MAKRRNIVNNARRQEIVAGGAERRAERKCVIANPARTDAGHEPTAAP